MWHDALGTVVRNRQEKTHLLPLGPLNMAHKIVCSFFLKLVFLQLSCLLVSVIFLVSVSYTVALRARYSFKY